MILAVNGPARSFDGSQFPLEIGTEAGWATKQVEDLDLQGLLRELAEQEPECGCGCGFTYDESKQEYK